MKSPQLRMLLHFMTGLLIMGLTAWLMSGAFSIGPALVNIHWLVGLIPAILISILALLICLAAEGVIFRDRMSFPVRRAASCISYFLNAVASGSAVGVLLAEKRMLVSTDLLLALIPAAVLAIILCLCCLFRNASWQRIICIIILILAVLLICFGIYVWFWVSAPQGCMAVFSGLYFLLFPVALRYAVKNPQEWHHHLSYAGFGAFVIIFAVVVIILSDGEALDSVDLPLGGRSNRSRRKHPR